MFIAVLTTLTMLAFAANSLLGRLALGSGMIDPVSFTAIRLASGALALLALSSLVREGRQKGERAGSWGSGLALLAYAGAFSLAYMTLTAGMGALVLFAAVQVTMIGAGLARGERLARLQWMGLTAAVGGLVYLASPGIEAPDPLGAVLMTVSGVAWGVYSIRGRGVDTPVAMTAGNFARAGLLAVAAAVLVLPTRSAEPAGVGIALVSGIVTSGLGYTLWYRTLRGLLTTQAAIVQLTVPVIAAFGGVIFLSEAITFRLAVASVVILGGVALATVHRRPPHPVARSSA